ncbi:PH and SEC7 domain-containing protein 1 [Xyrauchen texanus]|uniref:PH and SEC7 domain-containing protein 1 n=1 Tax=Xyrauchen texanus TaxID=154827 RepID=UPI002242968D|nr:PH and SEC7 domain-containing protein 1 [Xyrauchen texanus]
MDNTADYEETEPYLEAKQYIEKMTQETDGLDLSEHSVSLFPVTVPCTSLSYATVQWDVPETSAEPPSTGSVNELNSEMNWTVNLLSTDLGYIPNEEAIVDVLPEAEPQTDVTLTNSYFSQTCNAQKSDINTQIESSQDEIQTPSAYVEETTQTSDSTADTTSRSEENFKSSYGVHILMDTQGSEIQSGPESSHVEEEKEVDVLVLPKLTLTHQESSDSDREECTEECTETNRESSDTRTNNQEELNFLDQITGPDQPLEQETSDLLDVQSENKSNQPQESITDQTEPREQLSDFIMDLKELEEVELAPEQVRHTEEMNISVTVIQVNQNNEILQHSGETEDISEQLIKDDGPKCAEEPVSSVEKLCPEEAEDGTKEAAKHLELSEEMSEISTEDETSMKSNKPEIQSPEQTEQLKCPDANESSEQIQYPNEENPPKQMVQSEIKPLDQTEHSAEIRQFESSDLKRHPVLTDVAEHMQEVLENQVPVCPHINGGVELVDRAEAQQLAERLFRLDGFQRTDVVRHLDKDNEFSHAVGEEYLTFFDFTNQSLEQALRSFLKEVVLIGESQERERVLQHFSSRFQQCNPDAFSSAESVLTLTCALMLLNTDLHGQNVGKPMSVSEFVSNLDGMNGGENFNKDCLKSLYNSIKSDVLQWAIDTEVLAKSMMLEQDVEQDRLLRSKSNPFQDLPHNKKATVFQKGFLKRKAHADIDGKRTPWGKRSWKTFYVVLKGAVLYLQKDEYGIDWQSSEEVVSVHHALTECALNYTKRPHVFRLQTADWRVFLFEAASTEQMNSWIGRINLVSALYSSPPFAAAVGSQKKFCRPILPAAESNLTLDKQLLSHAATLHSFQEDLRVLQQTALDGRKAKARELEEIRQREEYLHYEKSRYEVYVKMLEAWQTLETSESSVGDKLSMFDAGVWRGVMDEDQDETDAVMKRSHSSPSLELETPPQPVVKVRRNISERRTYRKIIIPRRNKEL